MIVLFLFMFQVELFTAPIQKKEANEKLRMPAFLAKEVREGETERDEGRGFWIESDSMYHCMCSNCCIRRVCQHRQV